MKINENKIVIAWDLDETLGCFVELGMLWDALERFTSVKLTNEDFFHLLDLYPDFLRPDILKVLNMLKTRKKKHKNLSIILFTNNQGPKTWAELIVAYFNHKINYKLFDLIIPAYKIGRQQISSCRTSHEKKYSDLLNCMKLPDGTPVCFIDDQNHEQMKNDNVFYIHIKEYENSINFKSMLKTLESSKLGEKLKINNPKTINDMDRFLNEYEYSVKHKQSKTVELDKVVTKKLFNHLQLFLKDNETSDKKLKQGKKTMKHHANSETKKNNEDKKSRNKKHSKTYRI